MERVGTTVTREELLRSVWGDDTDTFTRTLDTHIASLRQKLERNPKKPEFILAVSGVGYRFVGRDSK
jgi:two-component system alkaline phosphatase synthesis response regulator PhoP